MLILSQHETASRNHGAVGDLHLFGTIECGCLILGEGISSNVWSVKYLGVAVLHSAVDICGYGWKSYISLHKPWGLRSGHGWGMGIFMEFQQQLNLCWRSCLARSRLVPSVAYLLASGNGTVPLLLAMDLSTAYQQTLLSLSFIHVPLFPFLLIVNCCFGWTARVFKEVCE